MPIMTRMREGMPVILFGLLILFLVMIVFEWGMNYSGDRGAHSDVVGTINGKKITYREFSETVNAFSNNIKAQTGKEPDEDQLREIRDQAWQTMVTDRLIEDEVQRLGLVVTDEELEAWVRGPNPPEDLRRNFTDSLGNFRQDVFEQFLKNPNEFVRDPQGVDPEYGTKYLVNYEKSLRQRRVREKLQSLVMATVRVSEGELRERFMDQSVTVDAGVAFFDPIRIADADVQVTDADLKAYYEENIEQFKVDAVRKINYVLFPLKPSTSDSTIKQKDIEEATRRARRGDDFLELVGMYSDRPDSGVFVRHGELMPRIESAVYAAKVGDIVGPVEDADGYRLVKVLDQRPGTTEYISASQILFTPDPGQDTNTVKAEAQRIAGEARRGVDFAELARKYSKDPNTAPRGGDLGWFARGRTVKEFEQPVFKARVGEIVGPIRTGYGWHVVKVTGRDSRELKIASITAKIEPTPQTKNDLFDRARGFGENAKQTDMAKEAQQMNLEVRESQVQEKSTVIPGIGINESLQRWVNKAKVGNISEPFTTQGGYLVASVTEIKPAGTRPLDEVKESLRPQALRKKKLERVMQQAADARAKLGNDSLSRIEQIAPGVRVQRTGPVVLGMAVSSMSRDNALLGAITVVPPGPVSAPVQGARGAYLVQVYSRSGFDSTAYQARRTALQTQVLQEKKGKFVNDWLTHLRESATIEDNRDQFFR